MRYTRVEDEQRLLAALSEPNTTILCGGTDLLVRLRGGTVAPEHLVDISRLPALHGVSVHDGSLLIGAATPVSDVIRAPLVQIHAPLLVTALRQLGSVQIRNRATLGGNIVNASPAADSVVPLLLYDAEVELLGHRGSRSIRIEEFVLGPGRTQIAPDEVLCAVRLAPQEEAPTHLFYHKVGRRNALTIAIVSVAMLAWVEEGVVREVRLAVGSVAPTPVRLRAAEDVLNGRRLCRATIRDALEQVQTGIAPISDIRAPAAYRAEAVDALIRRALESLPR